ncbi:DUF4276 family protein [Marinobacter sp. LV10R520-4]|uniref:DUF4276 family protein n=1 Tax=Marinobacter sp. LV10R520-4 TaxID=1761796 RepID=UPI0015CF543F|nr:DUF4276 family protein [Marinobacter sp. LV10R520-4]
MSKKIGIIAEDLSDIEVISEILGKYISQRDFSVKRFVGNGCGKLKSKCNSWASLLSKSGCDHILLFHDLDRNDEAKLRGDLERKVGKDQFPNSLIVIPIGEMEAWLLTDPAAIKKVFGLPKDPKVPAQPESIDSPKEHLRDVIWKSGKKRYMNTTHNRKIASETSLDRLMICKSYSKLDTYIRESICA